MRHLPRAAPRHRPRREDITTRCLSLRPGDTPGMANFVSRRVQNQGQRRTKGQCLTLSGTIEARGAFTAAHVPIYPAYINASAAGRQHGRHGTGGTARAARHGRHGTGGTAPAARHRRHGTGGTGGTGCGTSALRAPLPTGGHGETSGLELFQGGVRQQQVLDTVVAAEIDFGLGVGTVAVRGQNGAETVLVMIDQVPWPQRGYGPGYYPPR